MLKSDTLNLLSTHLPADEEEAAHLRQLTAFVGRTPAFASRSTAEGHVTASGWVVDATNRHVLLIHHAKLNRWLQPGGHVEPEDGSLLAAAEREVREETGLSGLNALLALFDVDVHAIPARGAEPEHLHYDCRFLFRATEDMPIRTSDEICGFRWARLDALVEQPDLPKSLRRMARKSLARSI